jgi:hypothetical protein
MTHRRSENHVGGMTGRIVWRPDGWRSLALVAGVLTSLIAMLGSARVAGATVIRTGVRLRMRVPVDRRGDRREQRG